MPKTAVPIMLFDLRRYFIVPCIDKSHKLPPITDRKILTHQTSIGYKYTLNPQPQINIALIPWSTLLWYHISDSPYHFHCPDLTTEHILTSLKKANQVSGQPHLSVLFPLLSSSAASLFRLQMTLMAPSH